jgi:hypothetical protein
MNRDNRGSVMEKIVLGVIVVIPLIAIVVYILNARGSFKTAPPDTSGNSTVTTIIDQALPAASPAVVSVDNPQVLPKSIAAGQIVPFSFTIENPGSTEAIYPYKVSVQWKGGETDVIDENSILLSAGVSHSIPESLKFEIASTSATITIEIQKPEQMIHFTLPSTQ